MNYAVILAGGTGTRMKKSLVPKQFINLKGKPIIIHTIEKFLLINCIDKIIVPCKEEWINELRQLLKNYKFESKVDVINGGSCRNASIKNSIDYIETLNPNDNDIIITHDAVRPFISIEIIERNINECLISDHVIDTCVNATDTIVYSSDNTVVDEIPNRDKMYIGQTPQSCRLSVANKIYSNKYDEYLFSSTDLCKLAVHNNIPIKITKGDYFNIKITTEFDLYLAKLITGEINE